MVRAGQPWRAGAVAGAAHIAGFQQILYCALRLGRELLNEGGVVNGGLVVHGRPLDRDACTAAAGGNSGREPAREVNGVTAGQTNDAQAGPPQR
jgi:hypothetical protein